MLDINNKYPEEFINWVDENINDLANEEAELCGEDVSGIIQDDWDNAEYDNLESEIEIWYDSWKDSEDGNNTFV